MNTQKVTLLILVDLRAAFDTVQLHEVLLDSLKSTLGFEFVDNTLKRPTFMRDLNVLV